MFYFYMIDGCKKTTLVDKDENIPLLLSVICSYKTRLHDEHNILKDHHIVRHAM
jgi:hypothetical protein